MEGKKVRICDIFSLNLTFIMIARHVKGSASFTFEYEGAVERGRDASVEIETQGTYRKSKCVESALLLYLKTSLTRKFPSMSFHLPTPLAHFFVSLR